MKASKLPMIRGFRRFHLTRDNGKTTERRENRKEGRTREMREGGRGTGKTMNTKGKEGGRGTRINIAFSCYFLSPVRGSVGGR